MQQCCSSIAHAAPSPLCCCCGAEIGKHADSPLLKGALESSSSHPHTQVHRRAADARQQLVELQALVGLSFPCCCVTRGCPPAG